MTDPIDHRAKMARFIHLWVDTDNLAACCHCHAPVWRGRNDGELCGGFVDNLSDYADQLAAELASAKAERDAARDMAIRALYGHRATILDLEEGSKTESWIRVHVARLDEEINRLERAEREAKGTGRATSGKGG